MKAGLTVCVAIATCDILTLDCPQPCANTRYVPVVKGDQLCIMLNNLGGTPLLELYICARRAVAQLRLRGAQVVRAYVGPFMTSLEMQGVSLSIIQVDPLMLARLDASTTAPAWAASGTLSDAPTPEVTVPPPPVDDRAGDAGVGNSAEVNVERAKMVLAAIAAALESEEANLTAWDRAAGDGDCGATMKRGADALAMALFEDTLPLSPAHTLLSALADLVSTSMGGTSGVLFEIGLRAGSTTMREGGGWPAAFAAGVAAVKFYGGADVGYRTMLDALLPAAKVASDGGDWTAAAAAAREGAEGTRSMASLAGRSNYVDPSALAGVPDPGAMAVATMLTAATAWAPPSSPTLV
jgi:dihydroxyacetone kinase